MASTIQFTTTGFSVDGLRIVAGHRIRLRVRAICSPPPSDDVRLIGGATLMVEMSGTGLLHLGLAHQTSVSVLSDTNPSSTVEFAMDLTREQLEQLERYRVGRDLTFIVEPAIHAVSSDRFLTSLTTQTRLFLSAAQWAEVLDQTRFADVFTLVVPLGDLDAPTRQATEELRVAMHALNEGRYESSISSARKVIEQMWRSPDGKSRVVGRGSQRSKWERVDAIADALYDLCSAAQHADQYTLRMTWSRHDAVLILSAVASLLAWHEAAGPSSG